MVNPAMTVLHPSPSPRLESGDGAIRVHTDRVRGGDLRSANLPSAVKMRTATRNAAIRNAATRNGKTRNAATESSESGQGSIMLIAIMGTFLFAAMAFSVDLTNMWFHRQATQTAADSACQAGALDMMAKASGTTPPAPGFTAGTASDCGSSASATICTYAGYNGYAGAGLTANTPSTFVSWTFPASVTGVTAPSASVSPNPFLKVLVEENVKTWFMGLLGRKVQLVASSCTCGLVGINSAAPMVVLDPTSSASLEFGGGAIISIVGGPQRSIQVNSSSSTAVQCDPSGQIDTSKAGPSSTGGDLAIYGGPATNPTCWGAPNNLAYNGGTTGSYKSGSFPVLDPYGGVPAPIQPSNSITASTPTIVVYGTDDCPDHSPTNYVSTVPHSGCKEFEPGYYPSGISLGANDVDIFKPGLYYLNGSLNLGGSDEIRLAKPCYNGTSYSSSYCGPNSTLSKEWQQTDGVIFYFSSGQLNISGGTGALSSSRVDAENSTDLTCDASSPPAGLSVPTTLNGNILMAQCTVQGYYYDSLGSTADARGSPGSRGIMVFQAHSNAATSTTFSGSGVLEFSGVMYYHATGNNSIFSVNGGSGTTSYMLGEIVADRINLSGSGAIKMALNSAAQITVLKSAMF